VGYTVPCTIDNLVAFGRDLLPLLSEAAMLRVTCGKGESLSSRRAICPNPHSRHRSNTVTSRQVSTAGFLKMTWDLEKKDVETWNTPWLAHGRVQTQARRMCRGRLQYGWLMVVVSDKSF
jgi:hypothetical protein